MTTDRTEGRNGEIWRRYCLGATQTALAEEYGISNQRVSQIIAEVRATLPEVDLAERRARHLESLDYMRNELATLATAGPIPAYSNGRPILDENGRMVMDHSGRLAAMREFRAFADREAKLLGLDQPVQVDVTVNEQAKAASRAAAADAMARLHGGTDGDEE